MFYLDEHYPSLYIFVSRHLNEESRLEEYMNYCKSKEKDSFKYRLYVHGYVLPMLEQKRANGKLRNGKRLSST